MVFAHSRHLLSLQVPSFPGAPDSSCPIETSSLQVLLRAWLASPQWEWIGIFCWENLKRKASIFPWNMCFFCKCSLKPIRWCSEWWKYDPPSGKLRVCYGKPPSLADSSTNPMFNFQEQTFRLPGGIWCGYVAKRDQYPSKFTSKELAILRDENILRAAPKKRIPSLSHENIAPSLGGRLEPVRTWQPPYICCSLHTYDGQKHQVFMAKCGAFGHGRGKKRLEGKKHMETNGIF